MPTPLDDVTAEIDAKRLAIKDFFASKNNGRDFESADCDYAQDCNKELVDLVRKQEAIRIGMENEKGLAEMNRPVHPSSFGAGDLRKPPVERKSLGEMVVSTPQYKAANVRGSFQATNVYLEDFDVKTTMLETGPGFAPPNNRTDRIVYSAQRAVMVPDLIPSIQTTMSVIRYMEETTFTNGAGMRAEGAVVGEAALAYTEQNNPIETLPVKIPVTEQQLEDVPGIQGIIDNRLMYQLQLTEESQILNGTGTSPELRGFLTRGSILTQARGADDITDAILKALTQVRVTGQTQASAGVLHPTDWQNVMLMRTDNGLYIWGSPNQPTTEARIWGVPFAISQAITAGTGLVGDFRGFSTLWYNRGVRVDVGYSDDDFNRIKRTIRMYMRLALEVSRQAAFCKLTGL